MDYGYTRKLLVYCCDWYTNYITICDWYSFSLIYIWYIHDQSTIVLKRHVKFQMALQLSVSDLSCLNFAKSILPTVPTLNLSLQNKSWYFGFDVTRELSHRAWHFNKCSWVSSKVWHFLHVRSDFPCLKLQFNSNILVLAAKTKAFSWIVKLLPDFK